MVSTDSWNRIVVKGIVNEHPRHGCASVPEGPDALRLEFLKTSNVLCLSAKYIPKWRRGFPFTHVFSRERVLLLLPNKSSLLLLLNY